MKTWRNVKSSNVLISENNQLKFTVRWEVLNRVAIYISKTYIAWEIIHQRFKIYEIWLRYLTDGFFSFQYRISFWALDAHFFILYKFRCWILQFSSKFSQHTVLTYHMSMNIVQNIRSEFFYFCNCFINIFSNVWFEKCYKGHEGQKFCFWNHLHAWFFLPFWFILSRCWVFKEVMWTEHRWTHSKLIYDNFFDFEIRLSSQ